MLMVMKKKKKNQKGLGKIFSGRKNCDKIYTIVQSHMKHPVLICKRYTSSLKKSLLHNMLVPKTTWLVILLAILGVQVAAVS